MSKFRITVNRFIVSMALSCCAIIASSFLVQAQAQGQNEEFRRHSRFKRLVVGAWYSQISGQCRFDNIKVVSIEDYEMFLRTDGLNHFFYYGRNEWKIPSLPQYTLTVVSADRFVLSGFNDGKGDCYYRIR